MKPQKHEAQQWEEFPMISKLGKAFLHMTQTARDHKRKFYCTKVKNICMAKKRKWKDKWQKQVRGIDSHQIRCSVGVKNREDVLNAQIRNVLCCHVRNTMIVTIFAQKGRKEEWKRYLFVWICAKYLWKEWEDSIGSSGFSREGSGGTGRLAFHPLKCEPCYLF